jgi:diguanylate cyclase (GGDEF)-like protein
METIVSHLIKQVLDTIADLGNSKQLTLYGVMDSQNGQVIGVFDKGKITLHQNKYIDFKGTPFEEIILKGKIHTYPGFIFKKSFYFPSYAENNSGSKCLCLPLSEDNKPVSSIVVFNQPVGVNIDYIPLALAKIVPLLAAIMETALENDRWIQLATKDTLTDLYTWSYFEKRLEDEVTRVRRHGGELSVILIEIDKFQEINDNYGYENGQNILREIGKIIKFILRQGIDIPCSYNNSFIILLPNTEVEGAATLAERIRQRCENQPFLTENKEINTTISAGIAHNRNISLSDLSKEDLIERSEDMLKAAKDAGDNLVMIWW